MIDFYIVRRGVQLHVATAHDASQILRLPPNRIIAVTADPKAPLKMQRWYRGAVHLLVEATGRWANQEIADREIMIKAGFFDSFVISNAGDHRFSPQSKSGWGYVEWRGYIDAALPVMIEFAGTTRAQYRDRVDSYLGIKLKEAWEET